MFQLRRSIALGKWSSKDTLSSARLFHSWHDVALCLFAICLDFSCHFCKLQLSWSNRRQQKATAMTAVAKLDSWYETTQTRMWDVRNQLGGKLRWPASTLPTLRLGSDCAGMEAAGAALKAMRLKHELVFASDVSKASQKWLKVNHRPSTLWPDMLKRNQSDLKKTKIDVYTAGFSCKPWSLLNGDQKFWRHPEARLFQASLKTIATCQPSYAILENVVGFERFWVQALKVMRKHVANYVVRVVRLCSSDLGKPMRRPRVWLLLVRQDLDLCNGSDTVFAKVASAMIAAAVGHQCGPKSLEAYLTGIWA